MVNQKVIIIILLILYENIIIKYYYEKYSMHYRETMMWWSVIVGGGSCFNLFILVKYGITLEAVGMIVGVEWLMFLTLEDMHTRKLSKNLLIIGLIIGVVYGGINPNISIIINNGIVLLVCLGMFGVSKVTRESIGSGDIITIGIIGILYGFREGMLIALLALFLGAVVSVGLLLGKKYSKKYEIAFVPFILCSTIIVHCI